METKNVFKINKDMYKVENGKVFIESDELANAIQNEGIDLYLDEEANNLAADDSNGVCKVICQGDATLE